MQVADDLTFEYASVPVLPTGGALLLWTALAAVGRLVPPRQGRR